MRTITLRTKTVLAALAGAGVLSLGTAAAVPATGVQDALVHIASGTTGSHSHSVSFLADDREPTLIHA
ncbi:hypothetical protein ABZX39_24720 [Streptomyces collinus]|uniref:hypothetical protein n=1 Tax=Streptomyces collinus TaxID=42684 RepID=UPI0033AA6D8F